MPYVAEISRANPSCFVFLIDQSGSMQDPFGSTTGNKTKADSLADAINRLLQNLVIKCAKSEGIRDYYHVGVIGYGGKGVGPAFSGKLRGKDLVPISEIGNNPARVEERTKRVEDGAGGLVEQKVKFPIWFDPQAEGGTPMCDALHRATSILVNWLTKHPNCFPPIVINISDGESTDGDPFQAAYDLMTLSSSDGDVLLFNLHLSSSNERPIEYPDTDAILPDDHAKLLFNMSSPLPEYMRKMLSQEGMSGSFNTRGFVFNADMVSVIRFLDIGTRPSNLR
ncbi:MAG TPA: vWA domain-containing protein [Candidatus Obscuribacterales bacterium]